VRTSFLRLAWPHLLLLAALAVTIARVVPARLLWATDDLSAEAVWGMLAFALLPAAASATGVVAAWQARTVRQGQAWDELDVGHLGGPA
jgi:hypothetical protein